jgi:hypothetical protein
MGGMNGAYFCRYFIYSVPYFLVQILLPSAISYKDLEILFLTFNRSLLSRGLILLKLFFFNKTYRLFPEYSAILQYVEMHTVVYLLKLCNSTERLK